MVLDVFAHPPVIVSLKVADRDEFGTGGDGKLFLCAGEGEEDRAEDSSESGLGSRVIRRRIERKTRISKGIERMKE